MAKSKPNAIDKMIGAHYTTLEDSRSSTRCTKTAVSVAFQSLLADSARKHHWTLIPQLADKQPGRHIRPRRHRGPRSRPLGSLG